MRALGMVVLAMAVARALRLPLGERSVRGLWKAWGMLGSGGRELGTERKSVLKRNFVPIPESDHFSSKIEVIDQLRILQFNILADGLSGLRADLGGFAHAKHEDLKWQARKGKLLYEILQYTPDIITLQECDHFYDFFLPELALAGYDGVFAPKPASACLEVSENSDGCAIFYKTSKIDLLSTEIMTYALAKGDGSKDLRVQNQVAIMALCQLRQSSTSSNRPGNSVGRSDVDSNAKTPDYNHRPSKQVSRIS
jgi:hypothetical protein